MRFRSGKWCVKRRRARRELAHDRTPRRISRAVSSRVLRWVDRVGAAPQDARPCGPPPSSAPRCAAPSTPRARPLTTVETGLGQLPAKPSGDREPGRRRRASPTMATAGRGRATPGRPGPRGRPADRESRAGAAGNAGFERRDERQAGARRSRDRPPARIRGPAQSRGSTSPGSRPGSEVARRSSTSEVGAGQPPAP